MRSIRYIIKQDTIFGYHHPTTRKFVVRIKFYSYTVLDSLQRNYVFISNYNKRIHILYYTRSYIFIYLYFFYISRHSIDNRL